MAGQNTSGSIINCSVSGSVGGNDYIGGLVGDNYGIISDSYSAVFISGTGYIGGLTGTNSGSIVRCYNQGSINGASDYVGGITGLNYQGTITSCYNSGAVTGASCTGGVVGIHYESNITDSYNTGSVNGISDVGGLIGYNNYSVIHCYSIGFVTGNGVEAGGLIGGNRNGTIEDSFWDIETSCQSASDGGVGKTTAQMQTFSTYTDAGWDFSGTDGDAADWVMSGIEYPLLVWEKRFIVPDVIGLSQFQAQVTLTGMGLITEFAEKHSGTIPAGHVISSIPASGQLVSLETTVKLIISLGKPFSSGSGSPEDPYQITDKTDLLRLASITDDYDKCYILMEDIDLSGEIFTNAVIAPSSNPSGDIEYHGTAFTGRFDGNGHKILNLAIHTEYNVYLGLFGLIEIAGQVRNLTVENADIDCPCYIGILAAKNRGEISNCHVSGLINDDSSYGDQTGGLIGWNEGNVTHCDADVSIGWSEISGSSTLSA